MKPTPYARSAIYAICAAGALAAPAPLSAQSANDAPSSTSAVYGDWTLRCRTIPAENAAPANLCEVGHIIRVALQQGDQTSPANPQAIAQIAIGRAPGADTTTLVAQVPQAVWLRNPVNFFIGDEDLDLSSQSKTPSFAATYYSCADGICLADIDLDNDAFAALESAGVVRMEITDASGQVLSLPVSVTGLASAMKAMSK